MRYFLDNHDFNKISPKIANWAYIQSSSTSLWRGMQVIYHHTYTLSIIVKSWKKVVFPRQAKDLLSV